MGRRTPRRRRAGGRGCADHGHDGRGIRRRTAGGTRRVAARRRGGGGRGARPVRAGARVGRGRRPGAAGVPRVLDDGGPGVGAGARRHEPGAALPAGRAPPRGTGCRVDARAGAGDVTAVVAGLAGAWGVLAAAPIVRWAHRRAVAERLPAAPVVAVASRWTWGPVGRVVVGIRRKRATARADAALEAALPGSFDLLVAAVGAGCAPIGAAELTARWGPAPVAERFRPVLVATELGGAFPDALTELATTTPLLAPMVDVLL